MLRNCTWYLVVVALAGCPVAAGCSATCDTRADGDEVHRYTEGRVDATRTVYETTAPDEPLLHFPPGREYELVHGLRQRPYQISIMLAFAEQPLSTDKNNLALAAGNQAVIERWDEEAVSVRNDTCATFYLRVALSTVPEASLAAGGAGGAGG